MLLDAGAEGRETCCTAVVVDVDQLLQQLHAMLTSS